MNAIAEHLVRVVIALFAITWRVRVSGECHLQTARDSGRGIVFALWHSRMVPLLWQHRHQSISMMVSRGRDGRRLSSIVTRWGFRVIEGSSTRGGPGALKNSIKVLADGGEIAVTPDGPTGPVEQAKPGATQAALAAGAWIIPVASAASWKIRLKTWDGFLIPLPFSRVVVSYGAPFLVDESRDTAAARDLLQDRLAATSKAAMRALTEGPSLVELLTALRVGAGLILVPVYWIISSTHRVARAHKKQKLSLPSIAVGGPTSGGDGKSPVSSWVAAELLENNAVPAILMRGYGGDEQLAHAELLPGVKVVCDPDRFAGCVEAARWGATVVVLDDALQRTDIEADFTIGVVAAEHIAGLRLLLPAGNWREGLASLRRADVVVVTHKVASQRQLREAVEVVGRVIDTVPATVRLAPKVFSILEGPRGSRSVDLSYKSILACAGIADPSSFFQQLTMMGAFVTKMPFGDHHQFSDRSIKKMVQQARGLDYVVVTQKDAVKLRGRWPAGAPDMLVADLQLFWQNGEQDLVARIGRLFRPRDSRASVHNNRGVYA